MPIQDLKQEIAHAPEQPGVYCFLGRGGDTLYVGKAAVLRDRLRSYLGAWGASPRIDALLTEAEALEYVVTDSAVDALVLENSLIKQRLPRYNIRLRDDKNYPFLVLTTSEAFPRVMVARRAERDGNLYAGPFLPASLARRSISLAHRLFGLRSCNEDITGRRGRPCLEHEIGRCIAPCVEAICTAGQYQVAVERTRLLLEGRNAELIERLERDMRDAADAERFEHAAHLRDAVRTLGQLRDRQQKMSSARFGDRDAIGVKTGPSGSIIQVFQMRGGRVIERVELVADSETGQTESEPDVLEAAIPQFYAEREVPPEIHVAWPLEAAGVLEAWLAARAGRAVTILSPRTAERRALLELATRNAAIAYQSRFSGGEIANYEALDKLREVLALPSFPRRVECFDISTLQGTDTVASLVVCEDGRMRKGEYRKFRVRGASLDDVASMREVVRRRYARLLESGAPHPDLVLIDGGAGQLSAAYDALEELGLANLVAVGLAKRDELIVTRDRPEPIALAAHHPSLLLLQRIRDEAHRFAVTFQRRARRQRDLRSGLDEVAGIGARRRRALLETFGSVAGVRRASREALSAVVGAKAADAVLAHFAREC
ncbi:MAG: uvrC 2 [Acidobacteria bacterium]|nr:uvrC 2 [Acidobacteriota bacterium]